jgi:glycosyltransferase involved in cell wall biosynthesis
VDTEEFAPRPVPNADRLTIVFAGKVARSKGVHLLVGAAVRLAKVFPRLRLQLLGRGEPNFLTEMKERADAAGCPDLLDTPGFVDRSHLPDLFSRAHIFAAPSPYEGGPGFVYLEAMACGLPVIACSGSGASEVIRHGANGLLVPVEDEDALTAALRALLQDADCRESMGRNARQFVLDEADSHQCMKKLEAFYVSVVKRASAETGETANLER